MLILKKKKIGALSSVILHRTYGAHTVVCFASPSFRQTKHLQTDFGLKSACCCQPKRFTLKIILLSLAVNALLGSQWKQMPNKFLSNPYACEL